MTVVKSVPLTGHRQSRDETSARSAYVDRVPGVREQDPGRYARRTRRIETALAWGGVIVLFGAWELASRVGWLDTRFWPAPTRVLASCVEMFRDGTLQPYLYHTLGFLLVGYVIGAAAGVVTGLLLGTFRYLRAAVEPVISIFYTIPSIALLPFLLLLFGIGPTPKVVLIASTVFFVVAVSVTAAMRSVPSGYLEVADSVGATPLQRARHVILPYVLPATFVSLRITAAMSVLVIVAIEFVQGDDGLGYVIWNSWSLFLAQRMLVAIVIVSLVGVAFMKLVELAGRLMAPWTKYGGRQ